MTTTLRNDNATGQGGEGVNALATTAVFSYPDPTTVKGRVLADLLAGRRITHLDCWREHGSSRLAHHCYMLRGSGWPIDTEEIEVTTRHGRQAQIGEYSLPADVIEEAGERGQRFIEAARRGA